MAGYWLETVGTVGCEYFMDMDGHVLDYVMVPREATGNLGIGDLESRICLMANGNKITHEAGHVRKNVHKSCQ